MAWFLCLKTDFRDSLLAERRDRRLPLLRKQQSGKMALYFLDSRLRGRDALGLTRHGRGDWVHPAK